MALDPNAVTTLTDQRLAAYRTTWTTEDDSSSQTRAARQLHQTVHEQLLPLTRRLLAERATLLARLDTARTDPATGLPTRHAFTDAAQQLLDQGGNCAVLFADLDDLKALNDTRSHSAGDCALRTIADRLTSWALPLGGVVGRLHGDEFALIVPAGPDLENHITQLRADLQQTVPYEDAPLRISASLGVALTTEGDRTLSALLDRADHRMYQDKGQNRGRRGRPLAALPQDDALHTAA
ncbi:GGDEF domain-containing protein [Streptacidiphilus sp. N1-3]|uniref:GGDEF domain-containing protein n=1 Tax=Streptacidiphilus alkalitolerans TaxID=3342712 RepID=A0ABV6XCQ5_9ACTN